MRLVTMLALLAAAAPAAETVQRLTISGLEQPVEILRDRWGVPHLYAKTQHDLFFAQGYITAKDRLFQLDLWRRIGTGKLAEVLGPAAIARDRVARLLLYRGDAAGEWASYAPDAKDIVTAFTEGINSFIRSLDGARPSEFRAAGYDPGLWAPEDVLARIAGLAVTSNVTHEFSNARAIGRFGLKAVDRVLFRYPMTPLEIPAGLDLADISADVLRDFQAATGAVRLTAEDGSNNWVVDGTRTASGKPLLANDPHRAVTLPSLRKTVHLTGPGWNVIGAGEPALPGVALGHNEQIAFGLTTIATDQQDLYVEKLNPSDPDEYSFQGAWRKVKVINEQIRVKGETPRTVELRYTHHGPIIYEDRTRHRAYALRSVVSEPGTAAYLPALSVARANNWTQFVDAMRRWRGTGHNFVYADRQGNIGWHATGLTPIRKGWNGLLPVPGDSGKFEWSGFVPAGEMPRTFNPPAHYIATANQNTIPGSFPYSVSFRHTEPFRFQRLSEIFQGRPSKFTVADFERIQHDVTSIPARRFQSILRKWGEAGKQAKSLLEWDARMTTDSVQAALFEVWMTKLMETVIGDDLTPVSSWAVLLEKLEKEPDEQRLAATWDQAVQELTKRLGPDRTRWTWGRLHTIELRHPIDLAKFHLSPVSRPGDQFTVNQTRGADYKQEHGASFREVIDLADWDRSTATNTPGEAGDPESPHYADSLSDWAAGRYHPLPFTRKAVEAATVGRILLTPGH